MYWLLNSSLLFYKNFFLANRLKNIKNVYYNNLTFFHNYDYSFYASFSIKNKICLFYFKKNSNYFYGFNGINNFLFLNFFKAVNKFFSNNNNILFLDSNYKQLLPVYNFIYSTKNVSSEKSFFFVTKNHQSKNNFVYFYKVFLKKYNIKGLVVLDYNYFKKFFIMLLKLNVVIFSFLNDSEKNVYIDYYFFVSLKNINVFRFIMLNSLISTYFYYYNIKVNFWKKNYLSKLKSLI